MSTEGEDDLMLDERLEDLQKDLEQVHEAYLRLQAWSQRKVTELEARINVLEGREPEPKW